MENQENINEASSEIDEQSLEVLDKIRFQRNRVRKLTVVLFILVVVVIFFAGFGMWHLFGISK